MLLAMMAAIASASPVEPVVGTRADCPSMQSQLANGAPDTDGAEFKRLVELPPAHVILTVLRTEDGCIVPVVVRYNVGAPPKPGK